MSASKHLGYQCAEEDIIDAVYCSHGDCVGGERHHALIRVTELGSKCFAHLALYVTSSEIMFGVKCCNTVRVLGEHIHMVRIAGLDHGVLYLDTLSSTYIGLPLILLHGLHSHTHRTHRDEAHPS